MEKIKLDPGDYTGTYKLIGEEISLDFINTISWRDTEREHEWLHDPANFIAWALSAKLIDTPIAKIMKARPAAELTKELEQVYATRRDLYNILTPLSFNKKPGEEAIKKLDAMIHKIFRHRHIGSKYEWLWDAPLTLPEIIAPVIWNAGYIITDLDHSRISHCHACKWVFYDKTKNRSRRWCDMEDCGSRDKSLRYYHRKKN